jgi:Ca2+-binding RTX toxin-like protein
MPAQTSKKTLLTTRSVALDTLDAAAFYEVTLSGNALSGSAHTNLTKINSLLKGDTLKALGNNNTLTGGAGNDLLISSGSGNLLVAGTGSDTLVSGQQGALFQVASTQLLTVASISGGSGSDTLKLGAGSQVGDARFSRVHGVEVLSLGGGASVTLAGSAKAAGISSVVTGAGGGTIQGASYNGSLTLEAGSAGAKTRLTGSATQGNLFVASKNSIATATLTGGARNDTLRISGDGSNEFSDTLFANLSRIDTLLLPGGGRASVTLGAGAERAGFTSVLGTNDGLSLRQEIRQTRAMTLVAGAGDDLFSFASSAQVAANSLAGGSGHDTIRIDTGTMADPLFRRVSGIEVLSLGSGSSATLGKSASSEGLETIVAASSNVTVQAGAMTTAVTLDASKVSGRVLLSGSSVGSLFLLGDAASVAASTLRGGVGEDTLSVSTGDASYADATFSRISGIDVMQLSGGNNSVTLGHSAALSGLVTLVAGSSGGDTITQTAGGFYLDASGTTGGVYFDIASPLLLSGTDSVSGTTIVGGAGNDTLIVGAGDFSDSGIFKNVSGIEALFLSGTSGGGAITLDGNSKGISTIIGSSGAMTFTQTEGAFVIDGTASESNLFDLSEDGALLADDTILGGEGVDSLYLGKADLGDDAFTNVSSVEYVSLVGSGSLALGTLSSAAGISSLYGSDEDNTISIDAGSYYINGAEATSNFFVLSDTSLLSANTIVGNNDGDTLSVASGSILDVGFEHLSGVTVLSLGGDSSLQLGQIALDAGIAQVYGGEGDVSVDLLAGGFDLEAGDATGSFFVKAVDSSVMAESTLMGNGDASTLAFWQGEIADDAFGNVKDVGTILLEGASSVTLGDAAASAVLGTVIGGAGDTQFYQTAGSFVLDGSSGTSNLFVVDNASKLAAGDTIAGTGNDFADTLAVANDDTLIGDTVFENISGVSVLSLTGSSHVTLGSAAATTGIVEVIAGDGASVFNLADGAPEILLDGSASSSLLVGIANATLASATTLYGGEGTDTLSFGGGSVIGEEAFTNVQSFEVLTLTGGSAVTLGGFAAGAYLDSVYGGSGINTITQNGNNANPLYLDGGSGQLRVELDSNYYLINDTILGGTGGSNTLSVGGSGTIEDNFFANDKRLQTLLLAGDNTLVLGADADAVGITKVIVEGGDNRFTQLEKSRNALSINASNARSNLIVLHDAMQLASDTLLGGVGLDTLEIGEDVIVDTAFSNHSSLEVVQLTGASSINLGEKVDHAGISTVIGGSGGTTFAQDVLSHNAYYLDGSADLENGNRFVMANVEQMARDTILGGDGIDTLRIAAVASILDTALAHVSKMEVLDLSGSGSVVLGAYADQSGIMTVSGGLGDNIFSQSSSSEAAYYLHGGGARSNFFAVDNALQASIDTFVGGSGVDTLRIGQSTIDDSVFMNHTSVEVLQMAGSSDVTLASAAGTAGISSIYGGSGATSLDASAMTRLLLIDASAGSGSSLLQAGSGADHVTGGSGADTLQGWSTTGNSASDTLFGGAGADLFVLGNAAANAYGAGGSKALLSDFTGGTDALHLHDYGSGASDYSLVSGSWGSGDTAYNEQLFDVHGGGSTLLANINYSGSNASGDLLGAKAIFA